MLVQIGGAVLGPRNFDWMRPWLAPHLRMIDVELPGLDGTRSLRPTNSPLDLADAIAGLIRSEWDGPVALHGISSGANMAMLVADRHPSLVSRLVLGGFMVRPDHAAVLMRSVWRRIALDVGMDVLGDLTVFLGVARSFLESEAGRASVAPLRQAFATCSPEAYVAGAAGGYAIDYAELAERIGLPVLLMGGRDDTISPIEAGASGVGLRGARRLFSDSRLVVFEDVGHCYFIERADVAARLIGAFAEGLETPVPDGITLE